MSVCVHVLLLLCKVVPSFVAVCVCVCACVCVGSSRSADKKRKSQMEFEDSFIHITSTPIGLQLEAT